MKNKIKIIFEDADIVVIDKPTGISVHKDGKNATEYTTADWVLENYPEIKGIGENIELDEDGEIDRPGIVHRLDKDTSGIMVIAKTVGSYNFLKRQFLQKNIKKVYRAIVFGEFKDNNGMIDKPIGRSSGDFRAKAVGSNARGEMREALTYYKVIERFPGYSLLELRPKTGRTHQLRVHLKSISKPIVCDPIYAKGKECPEWMRRLALHAVSIEIPLQGEDTTGSRTFTSELPKDFQNAISTLEKTKKA
ncbi:MAG: RluA family pseudouridine synthase [bacterium]